MKYNKKITNKTKKYEKIKNNTNNNNNNGSLKPVGKTKMSKYRMRQDTYEEASSNIYNNDLLHLNFPDSDDLITLRQFDNCPDPLCQVSTVNDNLKGLNVVRCVGTNELVIEYRGKVMYEKTYNVLPAKERFITLNIISDLHPI